MDFEKNGVVYLTGYSVPSTLGLQFFYEFTSRLQ